MSLIPKGGLVVSCQARADNPLHGPVFMAAMARAAEQAGAVALRANGPEDIAAIRRVSQLPLIGINKVFSDHPVYITPTRAAVQAVLDAGAPIVGLDCTARPRPEGGAPWRDLVAMIRDAGREVFADISTLDEGLAATEAGADYLATTLSGYTEDTATPDDTPDDSPDFALISALAQAQPRPVVAEGRIATPALAAQALAAGAHAVVVGTMITNPRSIAQRFVDGLATHQVTQ